MLATLSDLSEDALVEILTKPKNALIKQYQRLFEMEGVRLEFTDDALRGWRARAIARKTGARGLRSIMESILLDTMFDLPMMNGVEEVVINREVAEGRPSRCLSTPTGGATRRRFHCLRSRPARALRACEPASASPLAGLKPARSDAI